MDFDLGIYILLLCLGILIFYFLQRRPGSLYKMRGPKQWPIIGNALQIDPKHPHFTLTTWAKQYGDVYAINLFGNPVAVVSGEKEIREVLIQKPREFAGRPELFRASYLASHGTGAIAFENYSPSWRTRKKLMSNKLRMYGDGLQRLEEISNNIISDLIKSWQAKQGDSFDPHEDIHLAIMNIIFSLLCGQSLPSHDPLLKELNYYQCKISTEVFAPTGGVELDLLPWLRFFGHNIFNKIKDLKENHVEKTLKKLVKDHQKSLDPNDPKGVLQSLLLEIVKIEEATGHVGNDIINPNIIRGLLNESFAAGTQTTSSTLLALIAHCIIHQDFQDRLRAHIKNVIGYRQPLLKDRSQLPLVEAFVLEVLRMMTVLPTTLPHVTTESTSIADIPLPKGITVWINLWSLHHDERYWDNPWVFNPDRFLDDEGQIVPPDHPNRQRLLPFGAGQRVCIGESLARNRLFLFITSLLQHFHFDLGEIPPSCDPKDQIFGIALYPPTYSIKIKTAE